MMISAAVSPFSLPSPLSVSAERTIPPLRAATRGLRDSCDNCYKAKIKCSKTKPECERCINRGFQCAYLPSRRRGRTKGTTGRRASQNSPTQSQRDSMARSSHNSPTGSQRESTTRTSHPGSTASSDDLDLLKNLPDFSTFELPDFPIVDTLGDPTSPSLGLFSSSESARTFYSEPDITLSHDFLGTSVNIASVSPSANLGVFTPPTSAGGTPDGRKQDTFSHRPLLSQLDSMGCDCLSQSLDALHLLYKSSASLDSPQFDMIMTVSTWATNQCWSTLNCTRCLSRGGNSSLTLLLGTLLTQILAFYQAAILGAGAQTEYDSTQVMLGSFPVDVGAEQRLRLDMLRTELQRLQPSLGRFSKLCDRMREESSSELFRSLPESLENDYLNLRRLFSTRVGT